MNMFVCIWSHLSDEQHRAEKLRVSLVHLHHLCPLLSFSPLSLPFSSPPLERSVDVFCLSSFM